MYLSLLGIHDLFIYLYIYLFIYLFIYVSIIYTQFTVPHIFYISIYNVKMCLVALFLTQVNAAYMMYDEHNT